MLLCAAQHTLQSSLCFHTDTKEYPARARLLAKLGIRETRMWVKQSAASVTRGRKYCMPIYQSMAAIILSKWHTWTRQTARSVCSCCKVFCFVFFFCGTIRCYSANQTHAPRTLMPPGWVLCLALTHLLPVVPRKAQTSTGITNYPKQNTDTHQRHEI